MRSQKLIIFLESKINVTLPISNAFTSFLRITKSVLRITSWYPVVLIDSRDELKIYFSFNSARSSSFNDFRYPFHPGHN